MNKFEVTSIRVHKLSENEKTHVVGLASIVLNHNFLINDIKIIKKKDKMFCGFPSKRLEDGTFKDLCHPLNEETRKEIENLVLGEYLNAE